MPDHPQNVDKKGYRDSFHFSTVWKGKKVQKTLSAVAYKSGTGNAVALSLSTLDSGSHWDMVPTKPHHQTWYFDNDLDDDERLMKGFSLLLGEGEQAGDLLLLSKVKPQTCGDEGQGSRE